MRDIKLKFKKNNIKKAPKRFKNTGWEDKDLPTSRKVAKYIVSECLEKFEFRKSNNPAPHEYLILDNDTAFLFVAMQLLIDKDGYDQSFRIYSTVKYYRYYRIGRYRYWMMYDVLNRALCDKSGV